MAVHQRLLGGDVPVDRRIGQPWRAGGRAAQQQEPDGVTAARDLADELRIGRPAPPFQFRADHSGEGDGVHLTPSLGRPLLHEPAEPVQAGLRNPGDLRPQQHTQVGQRQDEPAVLGHDRSILRLDEFPAQATEQTLAGGKLSRLERRQDGCLLRSAPEVGGPRSRTGEGLGVSHVVCASHEDPWWLGKLVPESPGGVVWVTAGVTNGATSRTADAARVGASRLMDRMVTSIFRWAQLVGRYRCSRRRAPQCWPPIEAEEWHPTGVGGRCCFVAARETVGAAELTVADCDPNRVAVVIDLGVSSTPCGPRWPTPDSAETAGRDEGGVVSGMQKRT